MTLRNGFTLIEALITTVVLVTGLAAVAGVFSYSSISSLRTRQHTKALTLLSTKMEELRVDVDSSPGRYSEYLEVQPDGVVVHGSPGATFIRDWEVTAERPSRITVVVYGRPPGRKGRYFELARATTKRGRTF